MAPTNRQMILGRLVELREQRQTVSVEIDAAVKAIVVHFEPMDADLAYVQNIMPERLSVYVKTIERKMKILHKLNTEIKRLEAEVGECAT